MITNREKPYLEKEGVGGGEGEKVIGGSDIAGASVEELGGTGLGSKPSSGISSIGP